MMTVEWARTNCFIAPIGIYHWSRVFEYPWVVQNGKFKAKEWVLDAAGGDSPLQTIVSDLDCHVVNVDIDTNRFLKKSKALLLQGDIKNLNFPDNSFHKVMCISVLEHIEDPVSVIPELLRVLVPGGRLLVTMDVASYARWNHTIDLSIASNILSTCGLQLPPEPPNILRMSFPEIDQKPGEPEEVHLKVLCFYLDKPE
jgi:SAM-dependent methyltransferase